jgi:hypothetical protein
MAYLSRKRPRKPRHNSLKYLIKLGIRDPGRLPRHLYQPAWRDGVEVVANHPILAAIDGYRQLPRPRAVSLWFSRKRYDQARPRQGIFVRKHHDRPGFPHFRQLRVSPKIAPIKLSMLRGGDDSRLDARRLLLRLSAFSWWRSLFGHLKFALIPARRMVAAIHTTHCICQNSIDTID